MPRKTRRPSEFRVPVGTTRPVLWPRYIAIAFFSLLVGAGATYAVLRPALRRASVVRQVPSVRKVPSVVTASPVPALTSPVSPPALSAGLAPDQAARARGNWYEDHKQWTQAIASYMQAINAGLDNPDIRTDLGVAYYENGQPQNALLQYQAAQQQDPSHENSLFNQGSVYTVTGDIPKAIEIWRSYIRRFPHGQHVADARLLIAQVRTHGSQIPFTPGGSALPSTP